MEPQICIQEKQLCYHCGEGIDQLVYVADKHPFCCLGCQSVYQLLSKNNLGSYYSYNTFPGQQTEKASAELSYLDEESIVNQLIDFKDDHICMVTLYVPQIHCSSCIWLLENLYKIDGNIVSSRADFMKRQVRITFNYHKLSLKKLVELLDKTGYTPKITLQDLVKNNKKDEDNLLVRKIAVAGFCFGNAMMISFPEYFGMAAFEKNYAQLFGWINLSLALPAVLYCGRTYFLSSIKSLKQRRLNLDVPLALGIAVLFIRSAIEIIQGTGSGFADTLCGLLFFLLIGKWVQRKTYHHLSFERDYRSYFPIAVTRLCNGKEKVAALADLQVGDRILIRNNELVPADAILLKGHACIDFSFVTGESVSVEKVLGEVIYAGGKQTAEAIELEVSKPVAQSYLTSLWNQSTFSETTVFTTFSNTVSHYFTPILLSIAILGAGFWGVQGIYDNAWAAFTAVLIIGCPCALALSSPFTLSAVLSIFDKNGFYVKNTLSVEKMAAIDTLVFDKTGTITNPKADTLSFKGTLDEYTQQLVFSTCRNSNHPLSRAIIKSLHYQGTPLALTNYEEIAGKGIRANIGQQEISIGNARFVGLTTQHNAGTYINIDGEVKGFYPIRQHWRSTLQEVVSQLKKHYDLHLISGDTDRDRAALELVFPDPAYLHFGQQPADKLKYINDLQNDGRRVSMLGDGLNDAGALKQADLGIAISDDINNFSPACDAILGGDAFTRLPSFFKLAKQAMKVIYVSFGISLGYNLVGLYFAVLGNMSPLFAAVLMPLSTVTIVSFTSLAVQYCAIKNKMKR